MQAFVQRPALAAFVVALLLAEIVGEVPPLSRMQMYADLPSDRTTAILELRVEGAPVDRRSLDRFSGELRELPWPDSVPCTMRVQRDELRAYVLAHAGTSADPGPAAVSWGYVVVGWRDGAVREVAPFVVLAEGHAWPR